MTDFEKRPGVDLNFISLLLAGIDEDKQEHMYAYFDRVWSERYQDAGCDVHRALGRLRKRVATVEQFGAGHA